MRRAESAVCPFCRAIFVSAVQVLDGRGAFYWCQLLGCCSLCSATGAWVFRLLPVPASAAACSRCPRFRWNTLCVIIFGYVFPSVVVAAAGIPFLGYHIDYLFCFNTFKLESNTQAGKVMLRLVSAVSLGPWSVMPCALPCHVCLVHWTALPVEKFKQNWFAQAFPVMQSLEQNWSSHRVSSWVWTHVRW